MIRAAARSDAERAFFADPEQWLEGDLWSVVAEPRRQWLADALGRPPSEPEYQIYRCYFGFSMRQAARTVQERGWDEEEVLRAIWEGEEPEAGFVDVGKHRKKRHHR